MRVHVGERPQRIAEVEAVVEEVVRDVVRRVAREGVAVPLVRAGGRAGLQREVLVEHHPAAEQHAEEEEQDGVRQRDA